MKHHSIHFWLPLTSIFPVHIAHRVQFTPECNTNWTEIHRCTKTYSHTTVEWEKYKLLPKRKKNSEPRDTRDSVGTNWRRKIKRSTIHTYKHTRHTKKIGHWKETVGHLEKIQHKNIYLRNYGGNGISVMLSIRARLVFHIPIHTNLICLS